MVPLFGDMQIAPFNYIRTNQSFDSSKWPMCLSSQISPQSNLLSSLDTMRDEHIRFISELARHSNEVAYTLSWVKYPDLLKFEFLWNEDYFSQLLTTDLVNSVYWPEFN